MEHYLGLFFRAVFSENLALAFVLGMVSFFAVSKTIKTALELGMAVLVVQTITVPMNNLVLQYVLKDGAIIKGMDLRFLGLPVYIAIIAGVVQLLERVAGRFVPALRSALGMYLPLIAVNSAILGGTLFMAERDDNFAESVVYGFGSGFGWALAIAALAGVREKLKYSDVPQGLQGLGMTFITAGLISMAFMVFSGVKL
jgi:Na+-transporting NADH:ubiquinone oxidoreductase subunit E